MSSHKNKAIRERLERIYGKGCMFQKAHIAQRIEEIGGIKTYKQYIQQHKYSFKKVKKLEETMTLHHLKHSSEDGRTSEQNGAVVNALAHGYLHSLPRHEEELINNMLRDYKWRIDNGRECKIELVDTLDIDVGVKFAEISFSDEIKPPKEKFNRAKIKRETRNKIRDWEERKMITTETRYESYKEIIDKKKLRYNQILYRLDRPKTAKQIAVELFELGITQNTDRNNTAPRLTELVDVGIVSVVAKTKCEYTGKQVALYKKSDNLEKLIKENEKHISM